MTIDTARPRILCVRIAGPDAALREWLARCPTEAKLRQRDEDRVSVEVYVDERTIATARALGLAVEVVYDASARSAERQRQVGSGNRYADGQIPQGLGVPVKNPDAAR